MILTANEFKRHTQFPGDRKLHRLSRSSGDSSIFPASMKQSCRLDDYSRSALCSRTARNTGLGLILTMATTKFLTGLGLRVYRGVMARVSSLLRATQYGFSATLLFDVDFYPIVVAQSRHLCRKTLTSLDEGWHIRESFFPLYPPEHRDQLGQLLHSFLTLCCRFIAREMFG